MILNLHRELFNVDSVAKIIKEHDKVLFSPGAEAYITFKLENKDNVMEEIKEFLETI